MEYIEGHSNDHLNLNAQSVVPGNLTTSLISSSFATLKNLVQGVKNDTLVVTVSAAFPGGGTLTLSGAVAGAAGIPLPLYFVDGTLASSTGTITALGTYWMDISGFDTITATANAFGAGTINIVSSLSNYPRPKGMVAIPANNVTPGIFSGQTYQVVQGAATGSGYTVIAGVAGQVIYIVGLQLSSTSGSSPLQVRLTDSGTGVQWYYYHDTTNIAVQNCGTNQPYLFALSAGDSLQIDDIEVGDVGYQFGFYQF